MDIELANKHNWGRPTRNQHLQSDHRIATGYWTLGLACRVVWIPTLCFPNPQTKNEVVTSTTLTEPCVIILFLHNFMFFLMA